MTPARPRGQESALDVLQRLAGGSARTLLFAGPDGVGRRAAARWFAALLNCAAAGRDPCGGCEACRTWRAAPEEHVSLRDYREVAARATTRDGRPARQRQITIDQLVPRRDGDPDPLGPWLLAPPAGRVRVAVIDAAHELGESAANAFLKTLEEPPEHARIVLIAPGPDALLATVASRCTVVRFKPVALDDDGARGRQHPAVRLGRPAALARDAEREAAAIAAVTALDEALTRSLADAFEALPALLEAWTPGDDLVPGLLRERARARGAGAYLACDAALEAAEVAAAAYAHRALALKRLALALRLAWSRPGQPLPP